jgi:hypothetical protein
MLSYDLLNINIQKSCKLAINNNGFLNYNNLDCKNSTPDGMYELLCMIYGVYKINEYHLQKGAFLSDENLLDRIKIHYLMSIHNIYVYKKKNILYLTNFNNFNKFILYLFLIKLESKSDIYRFCIQKLRTDNNIYIKNYFKRQYIYNFDIKDNIQFKSVINKNDFMIKYKTIKKRDNFNEFNSNFRKLKKEAEQYLIDTIKTPKYKRFVTNMHPKIKPYKFDYFLFYSKNKKYYTEGVKHEFEKFKLEADLHYKKKQQINK